MTEAPSRVPGDADAAALVRQLLGTPAVAITRFRTGLAHYVYDVTVADGRRLAARMAVTGTATVDGAVYWAQRLRPRGVPLPTMLADDCAARIPPFPALILERLPGADLGQSTARCRRCRKPNLPLRSSFLDDTTTKNVLIVDGRLSGLVDVDYVCFGDPLLTLALTQMALMSMGGDQAYTEAWRRLLGLDAQQRAALHFYTCLFCVDVMSELGRVANHNAVPDDDHRSARLIAVFERLMTRA